jgi:hypothetical protein
MLGKPSSLFDPNQKENKHPQKEGDVANLEPPIAYPDEEVPILNPVSPRRPKSWGLVLVGLSVCGLFGLSGWAIWSLTTPPPSADCRKLSAASTDMERLYCAQEAARSGELPKVLAGMDMLSQWKSDHSLYPEAQRLIGEWSDPVLSAARQRIERSDLQGAIELASHIPKGSPSYKEAQAAIAEWKQFWKKGDAVVAAARKAMKASNWDAAEIKIGELREFSQDYWRFVRANALSQMLSAERQGRQWMAQSQEMAKTKQPEDLGRAIALMSKVDSKTYAWADAQPALAQWSETLLNQGFQNFLKGNLQEATNLATQVLPNPNLTQTAQDLLWLSQSRKHAFGSTTTLKPTLPQLWNLSAAISTASQIQPDSRYYSQAQANLKSWLAQLQDLTWLQTAYALGEVEQIPTLQVAFWQGQQITRDRPRRAQAQTLLVYWQQTLRKLEDRPYIAYAQSMAADGTIAAFKTAIAQAGLIGPRRPLRQEAQTLIANWTAQIQIIEDQPLLDRAWALANQGQLNAAMQVANGIRADRALYGQAQSAIGGWQSQIQAAAIAQQKAREQELAKQLRDRNPSPSEPQNYSDSYPNPENSNLENSNGYNSPLDQPATPGYASPTPSYFPSPEGSRIPRHTEPAAPFPTPSLPQTEPPPPPNTLIVPTEPIPPPPPQ